MCSGWRRRPSGATSSTGFVHGKDEPEGGLPRDLPGGLPRCLLMGMPGELPRGMPGDLLRGLSRGLPRGMPGDLPRGLPGELPRGNKWNSTFNFIGLSWNVLIRWISTVISSFDAFERGLGSENKWTYPFISLFGTGEEKFNCTCPVIFPEGGMSTTIRNCSVSARSANPYAEYVFRAIDVLLSTTNGKNA